jgi:lipid II:glycine glycyltransferase (peptidoglycan interpeptide bridge formation enzyme)
MKQKTRYNIRLATRKGVQVRVGSESDIEMLYKMYAETAVRDEFIIRDEDYYVRLWTTFFNSRHSESSNGTLQPFAEPLIAEVDEEPIAAVIIFRFAQKAWFLFGMSRAIHRQKMPNYLLQWEAIRRAKAGGCEVYDMWGAPDEFQSSDSLWGVFRFKQGFQGKVVRHIGAWDYPHRRTLYRLYTRTLPRLLNLMRWRGRTQLQKLKGSDI